MAGGAGERFWPASRATKPKQLLKLAGEQSLIEEAVSRAEPLFGLENILIATSAALVEPMKAALPQLPPENILGEPARRNTAGCLTWVAAYASQRTLGGNPVLMVLTADHAIGRPDLFRDSLDTVMNYARDNDALLTFGIKPTRPDTGFGYLEVGDVLEEKPAGKIRRVTRFCEKPDHTTAEEFLGSGCHLWNSGMFCWRLSTFLAGLDRHMPEHVRAVSAMSDAIGASNQPELTRVFESLPSISIDHALMEKAKNVLTLEADFPWDDLGTWDTLPRVLEADNSNNATQPPVLLLDSKNCVVYNQTSTNESAEQKPLVAGLGLENMVIAVTDDAILVLPRDRAQDVKKIVAQLKEQGHTDLI
jgi:mannose-1-phosphate guanylyltransferase